MAIKAKKLATKKGIKKSLSGGNSKFAQRVPEEGIEVRFLTEPEEWFQAAVHYGSNTSFPCSDGECLGCEEGMDEGKKFYANAYVPEDDRVVVFEMGMSVATPIIKRYDKNGTITDRNFEVSKEGTGKNTRYFVDPGDPSRLKGAEDMDQIDLQTFMEEWLERAMKEEGDEEVVTAARGRRTTKSSSQRRRPVEEDDIEDDDDDLDDEDMEETPRRTARKRPMKKRTRR